MRGASLWPMVLVPLGLLACSEARTIEARDPECGKPCYGGDPRAAGIGACRLGVTACDETGQVTACSGFVPPGPRQCNGLDNDCDGRTDSFREDCQTACGRGQRICAAGTWTECDAPQPAAEVCDGKDNDCDRLVDEVEDLPIEPCYTHADRKTLHFGTCRFGMARCRNGTTICDGEISPRPEVCNGLDDNCDGRIDEGLANGTVQEFVFVFDESGSMEEALSRAKQATQSWGRMFGSRGDKRFALLAAPDASRDGKVTVVENFTDAATFVAAVGRQGTGNTSNEPTLDAIYDAADPANPLELKWTAGSRRALFLFTDEVAQSYSAPKRSAQEAGEMAKRMGLDVLIFTLSDAAPSYEDVAKASGGQILGLFGDVEKELERVVARAACQ